MGFAADHAAVALTCGAPFHLGHVRHPETRGGLEADDAVVGGHQVGEIIGAGELGIHPCKV